MATESITETKFLKTQSNPLTLKITVGHAQVGGSYVMLISPNGLQQEIEPTVNGEYIIPVQQSSILSCVTTVQDVNQSTNKTSVTHDFVQTTPPQFVYQRTVVHHNDKVVYDIQYVFI